MSGESLPSGVLKVADLLIEARIEGDSRYTLRTSAVAFAKGAEFALNIARRYLASPPPQATGALSEERINLLCRQELSEDSGRDYYAYSNALHWWGEENLILAFARAIEAAHGITAASQVEPEEKQP